jgi:hypothetical protein
MGVGGGRRGWDHSFQLPMQSVPITTDVVCLMVFNATFNNISVISWWSVLFVEETRGPGENH